MTARRRSETRASTTAAAQRGIGPPPLPRALRWLAALVTFAAIAALVSFPIADPDLWQHLRTGRAIWDSHRIEPTNVWTWPTYGAPYVIPSWLFRVALWPFWAAGGVTGLFVWRWLTTLAAFALLWQAARMATRSGATGLTALFALLWCAVLYRFRSQVRPETLVAVLLAAQIAILEWRRSRLAGDANVSISARLDPGWLVVPIAVLWINVHLSYVLGLLVTGAYLVDEMARARRKRTGASPKRMILMLLASIAGSFLNPYGLGYVRQPFDFALVERGQALMRMITELGPIPWGPYLTTGLPLLVTLPVALALWRWKRRGPDFAELLLYAYFIPQGLLSQRFIGYTALVIAPFLARDASEFVAARAWPAGLARPAARAGLAALAAAVLLAPAFGARTLRPRIEFRETSTPIAAADVIAQANIRGRAFNLFSHGGYLLWRFWPDRGRLPFMDVHATGTARLRDEYVAALTDSAGWSALDRERRFDWVLLGRSGAVRSPLLDWLDADTTRWALVFVDDVAAVYVRRDGASAAAAEARTYRWLSAGPARLQQVAERMSTDSLAYLGMLEDLDRSTRESKWSAGSHVMLGNIALLQNQAADALRHYDEALRVQPELTPAREGRQRALATAAP